MRYWCDGLSMHLVPSPRLSQSFPVSLDYVLWALQDACRGVGHRLPPDLHGIWQRVLVHARLDRLVPCEHLPPTVSREAQDLAHLARYYGLGKKAPSIQGFFSEDTREPAGHPWAPLTVAVSGAPLKHRKETPEARAKKQ